MRGLFSHIKGDKIIRWGLGTAAILIVLEGAYVGLFYFSLPPYLPLFNQMPWGESRLGIKAEIFLPILLAISFLILNSFLLTRLYEKMPLLSRILSITTLLNTLLSFVFIVRTLQLVL